MRVQTTTMPSNVTKTAVTAVHESVETKEDEQAVQRLTESVQNLKEQAREMCHHIQRPEYGNMTSDSTEHRRDGFSFTGKNDDENHFGWCRWKYSWWIKVEQGLNSRQRRKVSRGLQRLVAREKEGTSTRNLIGHILKEIRAEIMMQNASNAHAQQYKLSSDDEDQDAAETRDHDGVDWEWKNTPE